jgi:hypothetical protein
MLTPAESDATPGREVREVVPCDENLPDIVAGILNEREAENRPSAKP